MTDDKGRHLNSKLEYLEGSSSGLRDMITASIKGENELCARLKRLATRISSFAGDEESKALKSATVRLGEIIEKIQDQRTSMCTRLEARCIAPITAHVQEVKLMRQNLKNRESVMQRMQKSQKKLDGIKNKNPGDTTKIYPAQLELTKVTEEANAANKTLNETMEKFEKKKNAELKVIYREYIHAQLLFAAKSLEMWTQCAEIAEEYDVTDGIAELHDLLYPPGTTAAGEADK